MPAFWWQRTFDFARQVYDLTKSSTRHDVEIKELRDEVKNLTAAIQKMAYEWQRDRDHAEYARQLALKDREMAAKDYELLLARLETKILSYERRLPPPADGLNDESAF